MPGFKSSWTGTLQNSDIMDYLMKQAVMRFPDASTRDAALAADVREGMFVYVDAAPTGYYLYTGSTWQPYLTGWESYTPTWANLTIGSGTQTGRYRHIGGDMRIRGFSTLAADSSGTGLAITQTLPNSATSDVGGGSGVGAYNDAGTRIYPLVIDIGASSTALNFFHAETPGVLTSVSPVTIGTGDIIRWDVTVPLTY